MGDRMGSSPIDRTKQKEHPLDALFVWLYARRDLKGGTENAPVERFPAPGFRARPPCAAQRANKAMPMAEIKFHRPEASEHPLDALFVGLEAAS
ncbi:MAG TPA: hypothetical protein PKB13_01825 [Clostridia bacterium]|nr:hypothetical protein [Clostridia bacterium]